jgi:hypothetical protein
VASERGIREGAAMIIVKTLCAGCGREIAAEDAFIKEGVPYCCESCAENGQCERGCGSDILAEEPPVTDPCL